MLFRRENHTYLARVYIDFLTEITQITEYY